MPDRQLDLFPAAPVVDATAREVASPPGERPPNSAIAELAAAAADALDAPVELVLGRSRRHPVQLERGQGPTGAVHYRLRLHAFFAEAPAPIVDDLAAWLRAGRRARRASARLDAWIAERLAALPPAPPRALRLDPTGAVHDLAAIARAVAADPTAGPVARLAAAPVLGWGRWPTRPPRRRLQLGVFDAARRAVRVHPILDDARVPETVVAYIVFHELLHAAVGNVDDGRHHGPTFRTAERAYAGTADACAWIDAHTATLVRRVNRRVRDRRR